MVYPIQFYKLPILLKMNFKFTSLVYNIFNRSLSTTARMKIKVKAENYRINYETSGSKGKVVLCLPGSMGCAMTDFGPQLESLGNKNLEAIFWDPPGYGKSRPPSRDFSGDFVKKDAEVAAALMQELDHKTYSLLGWSDGGITALQMALLYPDRIEKLVVWGANAYIDKTDLNLYAKVRDISEWSERMRKPMEDIYGAEYFKTTWEQWVDAMIRLHDENNGQLLVKDVSHISCPTLIIHGMKDAMVGEHHARYLHEKIKNSQMEIFEDGKHNLHLKYADKFNELVAKFLHK